MTKKELYEALQAAGVKLPEYRRINTAALQDLYRTYIGKLPEAEPEEQPEPEPAKPERPDVPPVLIFDHAGWCEALGRRYFIGHFQPMTWEEYEALRPFAKGGVR